MDIEPHIDEMAIEHLRDPGARGLRRNLAAEQGEGGVVELLIILKTGEEIAEEDGLGVDHFH
jgi:hypothetical protein